MNINNTNLNRLDIRISLNALGGYLIALFACFGFLLSVTQTFGESRDYFIYDEFFNLVRNEGLNIINVSRFELGFSIISVFLTSIFTSNVLVYSLFVIVVMLIKGWIISIYSARNKVFIVVAVFYLVRYFSLYELTQLRAACAIGFLMIAATFFLSGNRVFGILACVAASMFHMSAILVIATFFLQSSKRSHVLIISFFIFALIFTGTKIIAGYLENYIKVLEIYQNLGFGDIAPNPFSVALLLDWTMIAISLTMWKKLTVVMRHVILFELIGMAMFYGLLDYPILAHRYREIFSVFWLFFVAGSLRQNVLKIPTIGFVVASVAIYSYIFILSKDFFHP
jgi:hypothetical protein